MHDWTYKSTYYLNDDNIFFTVKILNSSQMRMDNKHVSTGFSLELY